MDQIRKTFKIEGMSCSGCEMRIENRLIKIDGVFEVKADYKSSCVSVYYDSRKVKEDMIISAMEKLDYKVADKPGGQKAIDENGGKKSKKNINQILGIGIILFALYLIINNTIGFNFIPQINQNMGYGILFVIGVITSIHCIAMCGGINLSQCVSYQQGPVDQKKSKLSKLKPSLMYNAGRVISYTIIGGIVGVLGSAVSFSGAAKGIIAIISGIFMVIMGLNMLNIFPWLRKINPHMPKIFGKKINKSKAGRGPFVVGLLNGLMPCGPLQAMQIYALGTGSFFAGALSMFMFSLGTVPLMFGFGAISSFLSGKFTHRMMKVSAVLVMVLGLVMVNRGLSLSGVSVTYAATGKTGNVAVINGDVQEVTSGLSSGSYEPIVVQKGIPVKWNLKADAKDLNGCNETILVPKYNIQQTLKQGDNIIEFTPDQEGNITFTCWMGMISSNIKVVSDLSGVSAGDVKKLGDQSGQGSGGIGGGGCCGPIPPEFANGKVPTGNIQVAKIANGKQEATVTVNNQGYTPAVIVMQKGVEAKIKFNGEQLSYCNSTVVFPEFQGQIDISTQKETPSFAPDQDFTFQCSMNMLHGYVKVVDDINNINLDDIKKEIDNYVPQGGAGGGGCCG